MWDLNTLHRINQKAAQQAREGKPERDALFLVTGITDPSNPFLHQRERLEQADEPNVITVGGAVAEAA
jgi:hypothetical protein